MEKQIEEMSKEIANILIDAAHKACEDIPFAPLDLDSQCPVNIECHRCKEARMFIAKGYRKQSDTAREIFAEIGKILTAKYNAMQSDCHHRMRFGVVDSPAGMKEFGMVSGVKEIINEIKAFEEKYMKGE